MIRRDADRQLQDARRLRDVFELFRADDAAGALFQLQRLENEGHPHVAILIAQLYETGGRGVQQDIQKALNIYHRLAEQNEPDAIAALGRISFTGAHGQVDYASAFQCYDKLARAGDARAQFVIGNMYLRGIHVERDVNAAYSWFVDSAAAGNLCAMTNVAVLNITRGKVLSGLVLYIKSVTLRAFLALFDRTSARLFSI